MSEVSVEKLKSLCKELFIQKAHVGKLKEEKTKEEKKLTELEENILNHLDALELKNFDTGFGKISKRNAPYAKIVDTIALTKYLKERELFDDMITFNAAKMNSWYNEEREKAKEEMNLDFKIDGMEVSSNKVSLSVTGVDLTKIEE